MDSPETCPTCKSKPGYRSGPFCLGSHPDKWHETHRDPTPTGRIYPDCTCAWKVPDVRCPWHATPTPPAPADARPMVVGGAFVKFDRPAPAPDAGAAERARRIEEALRKIANYAGPIVCEHYETCRHEACDFAYFAQTLAADTLNGTTTEIGDAAEAERAGRRGTNQAKRGNDARKGGEGA